MSNEELAEAVRQGQADVLALWRQVRRFAVKTALKWAPAAERCAGVTVDDLIQESFIALVDALEGWDASKGTFIGWYVLRLKAAFSAACGFNRERTRQDPLHNAASLDTPVSVDEPGDDYYALLPDPTAQDALDDVEERDRRQRLHAALEAAISSLPVDQATVIRAKYFQGREVDQKLHARALRSLRNPRISRDLKALRA